jgi:hypothetical protein
MVTFTIGDGAVVVPIRLRAAHNSLLLVAHFYNALKRRTKKRTKTPTTLSRYIRLNNLP